MELKTSPIVLIRLFPQKENNQDEFWTQDSDSYFRQSLAVEIIGTIVLPIICTFGICGNGVSFAILCRKELKCGVYVYLAVLAFNNTCHCLNLLLAAIGTTVLPDSSWNTYILVYCMPVSAFINTLNVLTTLTLSIDRCLCIIHKQSRAHPFYFKKHFARQLICGFIVFCVLYNLPECFLFHIDSMGQFAINPFYFSDFYKFYAWFTFVFMGVIPTLLLFLSSTFLCIALKKLMIQRMKINERCKPKLKKHFIKLNFGLTLIVVFFLLTQVPCLILNQSASGRIFYDDEESHSNDNSSLQITQLTWIVIDAVISSLYSIVYYIFCPPFKKTFCRMIRGEKKQCKETTDNERDKTIVKSRF